MQLSKCWLPGMLAQTNNFDLITKQSQFQSVLCKIMWRLIQAENAVASLGIISSFNFTFFIMQGINCHHVHNLQFHKLRYYFFIN